MKKSIKRIWLTASCAFSALAINAVTVLAEGESSGAATNNTSQTPAWYPLVMIGVFALVGYFMIIRPEKKRKKEASDMRDSLKPGDRITTIGGIVGTVETVTDEEITLTNGLVLKRWALRSIEEANASESPAAAYYDDEDNNDSENEEK